MHPPDLVVEWSPNLVLVFDPRSKSQVHYGSIHEASAALGSGKNVRIAVARRSSFIKPVRVPDTGKAEILQMLRLTAANHLPLPANEIAFDVRLTDDVSPEGRLAIVAAVRSEELRALQLDVKNAGWNALDILPASFGSILVAQKAGLTDCTVVQKTDEGWTLDLICRNELRYSRAVPKEVPAEALDEEVVRTYAAAGIPCGPVLAAGGISLDAARMRTDFSSLELLASTQADAIGIHLELRETIDARAAKIRGARMRNAVALALGALLLAGYAFQDRANAQIELNHLKAQWSSSDLKTNAAKSTQLTRKTAAQAVAADLDRAFHPAQRVSDVLSIVGNLAPQGVWLTGVDVERGKPLLIRGTATSSEAVAGYVNALAGEKDKRFRDVRLVFANNGTIEQRAVVQFSVQGFPVGNLPLVDQKQIGKAK